ncbi:TolC family protein [Maridesulfovibrio sp.]|uniref:TolC family protein n=1 Tax=Maridesulfovibrio sp. TaxID=2795000 RepID=UPI002A18DC7F|nr:TolC family protein [Maridesulfovibrio sp.]
MTRSLIISFIMIFLAVSAHAEEFPYAGREQADWDKLRNLLAKTAPDSQQIRKVTPLETTRIVLENNLSIKSSEMDRLSAAQALREAESLFDPTLLALASYSKDQTYSREVKDYKYLKNTVANPYLPDDNPIYVLYEEDSPILYLRFDQERVAGEYLRTVKASEALPWKYEETQNYAFGIKSNIVWGPTMSIRLGVRRKDNYWQNDDGNWGVYDYPWSSEFRQSLSLPLPYTKNFGPYSTRDTEVKQATILQEAADYSIRATVNDALLAGELAYWDIVAAMQKLLARDRHRLNLKKLLEKTRRLYDERLCTEYDLALVQSAYSASIDGIEQGAASYRTASNQLAELTDSGDKAVFFPAGYYALSDMPLTGVPGENEPDNVSGNPHYERQLASVALAELSENHYELQTRPDIRAGQTLTLTQQESYYGYSNPGSSLKDVFSEPDLIRQVYSLEYTYPLFNRDAISSHEQAILDAEQERATAKQLQNSLRREAYDALALLKGARKRIKITAKGIDLAREAYEKAISMQADREVVEYEIVSKSANLLSAEISHIEAYIDCYKAAARFMAASGSYQKRYGIRASHRIGDGS